MAEDWYRAEDSEDRALHYAPMRLRCIEVSVASSDSVSVFQLGHLDPDEIDGWLQKGAAKSSHSHSMLRILIGKCGQPHTSGPRIISSQYTVVPFDSENLERVIQAFEVPKQFIGALKEPFSQFAKFRNLKVNGETSWSFIFKLGIHATGYHAISVSFEPNSRLISVLLLSQTNYVDIGGIIDTLQNPEYNFLSTQPMLVPFIIAKSVSVTHAIKVEASNRRLVSIEEHFGQHTYYERPRGDPLGADFVTTTTSLNSNGNMLGINENRLNSLMLALKKMQDYNAKIVAKSRLDTIVSRIEDMDDLIEHLYNYASNLLTQNTSEQKRTQTHLAVVFNFMAQKDNLLNISLANDSRRIAAASQRDSTAMKTISVVTMVFLPGTYIAALFAIPLFNWGADDGSPVLSSRFWYYWATTLPLTAAVLLCWIVWEPLRTRLLNVHALSFLGLRNPKPETQELGYPQLTGKL